MMGKNDELQKAILNNIPDQAWLKDRESHYILVNEAFMAATGLSEDDILGKKPTDVWPTEWGRKYIETDQEVMRSGQRLRYEEWRQVQDGTQRWFDTIKTPILDDQGHPVGTAGISRDITDRKQAEQALDRLNRLYAVRSRTNQAIVRLSDRDQLFYRVCRVAVQSGGLQLAWIGLFDEQGAIPRPSACFSGKPPLSRKLTQLMEAQADPEIAKWRTPSFRHFVCNHLPTARHFTRQAELAQTLGFSSFAAFPLEQGGQRAGIFMLYAAESDFFSDDIVQLLDALSADLSYALDFIAEAQRRRQAEQELLESRSQLRELSAYLQSVREEERTRISRELHDELGQSLTAIRIGLGVIETQRQMQPQAWLKSVQSLKAIADSTIQSVQRIAADLRPLILDELGLPAAVDWLLESFSERTGVAYELLLPGAPLAFSQEISTAIFRILQEALTNVSRHGQATLVVVELKQADGMITLKITDNGQGIDKAAVTSRNSLGLVGMRERAYKLGGSLKIQSRPGAGTSVEVRIPKEFSTHQERAHDPGPDRR